MEELEKRLRGDVTSFEGNCKKCLHIQKAVKESSE